MPLQYDPDFYRALEPLLAVMGNRPKIPVHHIQGRRDRFAANRVVMETLPDAPGVVQEIHHVARTDKRAIPIHAFIKQPAAHTPGPAVLHIHGGGMIAGTPADFRKSLALWSSWTNVPIFSVDYRCAPEHKDLVLVNDCYTALQWLMENAQALNIDPTRIALFGESSGAGAAAGVALMARDKNLQPPIAKQLLIEPMLDDRNLTPNAALAPFLVWSVDDNITGWTALLGDKAGKRDADVSHYASPARAKSLTGLPATYIDVGDLDLFRDEAATYAMRIAAENINTEFHLYSGVPHAFEWLATEIALTKRATENRIAAMTNF
ncbi:hypothetical protein H2204_001499 [Knufia peltigerae]|uniref:Alpha/beta hydrolase fold-3 domain-containing protein n=1 Tax=Knufia peltigerae TaxID=1002370 RepID=A0AA38YDD9_9EURO|nr:hypothetical protein H2204_001499 [Knufia peltigerae]